MREAMECTNARELLFDHRRGRLDDMELVLLEGHLEECATCRDHQMRLVGMLDSTAALQPAREIAFDKDSLFERIAREVKTPPVEAAPRDVAPPFNAAKKAVEIHEEYQRRASWSYIVAALAACVLAIFLIPRLLADPSLEIHGERMVELILESDEGTSTPEEGGLVLSSIVPSPRASTQGYLDIQGDLDISAHEAKRTALRDAAAPSSAELSRARDRAPLRPRKPSDQGSDKESEQARRAELLESGRRAMAARDYAEAANHYEALLGEMPGTDPASMTIRLDLARLYRQHLDEPERAIGHLRTFVMNRPDDVAAPSAVRELCRLLSATDERDPLCIGR
jgi:hypothetical protein